MRAEATTDVSDERLMRRVAEGDLRAFETIHDRYHSQVLATANRLTRQPAAAEEVAQDAFLSLWRNASRFDPSRASLGTWLLVLVHSRGIDAIRRRARHDRDITIEDPSAEHLQAPGSTEDEVADRDESRHLRQLLSGIPGKQRQVVELAYFGELSHVEIARDLGLPLGTVKGRLRLAMSGLRNGLVNDCPVAA